MKILMVAPQPFFEPRGTPISIYQRLEALSAIGHHVDLLTYPLGQDVTFPNVRIFRTRRIGFIRNVRVGPSRAKILLDFFLMFKTLWMLITNHYDVIHSHEEAAFFCAPLSILFRRPHLYDMHSILPRQLTNFDYGNRRLFIRLFECLEKMVLKTSQAVITIGSDIEEYVIKINPTVLEIKIENIGLHAFQLPVEPQAILKLKENLGLNEKVPVIYAGTFERYQGLEMVLESAHIIRERFPEVVFVFVGAKRTQVEIWTEKAQAMGVDDCTVFINAVSPQDSMVFLAYAKILISPRIAGTSVPLKIYSYMHSGKPIVATNIPAHTQVLNKDIALLVEPTKEDFAEGIITLLSNQLLCNQLGENAYRFALEHFNYQEYEAKVKQIYQSLEAGYEPELQAQVLEK
jgi:glycosyltransferase involved in cell wall biosynthesis